MSASKGIKLPLKHKLQTKNFEMEWLLECATNKMEFNISLRPMIVWPILSHVFYYNN